MSDPNHMHEFDPNKRGLCKQYTTNGLCHLPETAPVHTRWAQKHKEDAERSRLTRAEQLQEQMNAELGYQPGDARGVRVRVESLTGVQSDILTDIAAMSRRGLEEAQTTQPGGEIVRAATYMRLCVKSLKSYLDDHPNCTISTLALKDCTSLIEALSTLLTNAANDSQQKFYADLAARPVIQDAIKADMSDWDKTD